MARLKLFGKSLIDSENASLRIQPYKGGWLVAESGVNVGTVKRMSAPRDKTGKVPRGGSERWVYKPNDPNNEGPLHTAVDLLGEYFRENPNAEGAERAMAAPMLVSIRAESPMLKKVNDA